MPRFRFRRREPPDAHIVVLRGELDLRHVAELDAQLALLQRSKHVVVDLCEVTFIDSTVLGLLVAAKRRADEAGGRFALVIDPDSAPARTLELAGVREALPTFESRGAAVEAVNSQDNGA